MISRCGLCDRGIVLASGTHKCVPYNSGYSRLIFPDNIWYIRVFVGNGFIRSDGFNLSQLVIVIIPIVVFMILGIMAIQFPSHGVVFDVFRYFLI